MVKYSSEIINLFKDGRNSYEKENYINTYHNSNHVSARYNDAGGSGVFRQWVEFLKWNAYDYYLYGNNSMEK
jgi:hypothetical protein